MSFYSTYSNITIKEASTLACSMIKLLKKIQKTTTETSTANTLWEFPKFFATFTPQNIYLYT